MKNQEVLFFIDLSLWDPKRLFELLGPWSAGAAKISIHWVLTPSQWPIVLGAQEPDLEAFTHRLATGEDRILPVNFSGFDHRDFFPGEAGQDCGWCYHHPEIGLSRYLGLEAGPVFLSKTPAQSLGYTPAHAYPLVLKSDDGRRLSFFKAGVCDSWPLSNEPANLKNTSEIQVLWWSPDPLHDTLKVLSIGQGVIKALAHGDFSYPKLENITLGQKPQIGLPTLSPREKAPLAALGERRRTADVPPLLKNFFHKAEGFPGTGEEEDAENAENLHGVRKRTLIASMQGESILSEGPFQVIFQGGHPQVIQEKGTGKVFGQASIPYITTDLGSYYWRTVSAFSLEGDYSWGLRQTLALEGKDVVESGRMVIDHFFVEESQGFFQSVSVRFPRWDKAQLVKSWAFLPWEFPLMGSPHTYTRVQRTYGDGTKLEQTLGISNDPVFLEGTDFSFALPGYPLILSFPQNQTPRPHTLETRLQRNWSRTVLKVNPEGGSLPRPCADFTGWDEHFNFVIHFQENRVPFTPSRKQANELMPPFIRTSP